MPEERQERASALQIRLEANEICRSSAPNSLEQVDLKLWALPRLCLSNSLFFRGGGKLSIDHLISHFSAH